MTSVIAIVLISYFVPAILSRLSEKTLERNSDSTDLFVMRPVKELAKIGLFCGGFFLFCIIGSSIAGQFEGLLVVIFGGLFLLGVLLILVTVKGFWEVTVDGNKVTSSRIWIIKKTISIEDIDYCIMKKGGIDIYLKGKKHKAMNIDGMCENIANWQKRMEEEGIEIRVK